MESPIAKKKTLLTLGFNNMKDNFDKLFNIVLILTAFASVYSTLIIFLFFLINSLHNFILLEISLDALFFFKGFFFVMSHITLFN